MIRLRPTIGALALRTGALSLWRRGALGVDALLKRVRLAARVQRGVLIFVFHRISDRDNPFRPGTPLGLFDQVCAHLAEHYEVLPLDELERRRFGRRASRAVAITFDDGYADNHRLALPVLRRYGLPATVFITTGCMEGRHILWTSRLAWTLEHGVVPDEPVILCGRQLALNTPGERLIALAQLKQQLKEVDESEREEALAQLAETLRVNQEGGELQREMLTWDELREMEASRFIAGAHTVSHPILSRESEARQRAEICDGRDVLEAQLRRRVDLFAYPNGGPADYDETTVGVVRSAGFRLACTMRFAANDETVSPYELRRVSVYMDNFPELALYTERFFYLTREPAPAAADGDAASHGAC